MTITQAPRLFHHMQTYVLFAIALLAASVAAAAAEPPTSRLPAADHPLAGRIWERSTGRWITPDAVLERARAAGIVLLGETHDNPDHHALQAWVVRGLAEAGRRPVVALEMVDADRQASLDAGLGDLDGLGKALEWEKRGWPDWALYRPIIEAALAVRGEVKAANLPQDLTRRIGRGEAGAETEARFGLDQPLPPAEQKALEADIRDGHCNMLPDRSVSPMVKVQRARDAAMAEVLAEQAIRPETGPAVLIAGAGHVRDDRGVPARLRQLVPGLTMLSVGFMEVEADKTAPRAYGQGYGTATPPFDLVWFTARAAREDQCAALERHMKKKADGTKEGDGR